MALVQPHQAPELEVLPRGRLGAHHLAAQLVALLAQVVALGAGVEGVVEPAEQVAEGLERPAGALLDGRQDLQDPTLDRVEAPTGRFAEVCG